MTTTTVADALAAGAAGLFPTEAAIGLLIDTGLVDRVAFDWSDDRTMAFVDWDQSLAQPLSGGQGRIIRLARQIYDGEIDVSSLDADRLVAVTDAIRHANNGTSPDVTELTFLHGGDYPETTSLIAQLPQHVHDDGLVVTGPTGLAVDWQGLIDRSRLSSTEIGLVHAARAIAVFERHGTGTPFRAVAATITTMTDG